MKKNKDLTFADVLIQEREKRGWSRYDMANELKVSYSAIWYWENHKEGGRYPRISSIMKVARRLDIRIVLKAYNKISNPKREYHIMKKGLK